MFCRRSLGISTMDWTDPASSEDYNKLWKLLDDFMGYHYVSDKVGNTIM